MATNHRKITHLLLFIYTILLLTILSLPTASLEATWTPNPDDSGPLPLSLAQRQQLLELEVAITSSPDPSSTLAHVAQQNGMSQEELVGMLNRNRDDLMQTGDLEGMLQDVGAKMQQQGAGGGGRSMAIHNAPRNGIVISTGAFPPFSRGHTTILEPPMDYVQNYYVTKWERGGWEDSLPPSIELNAKQLKMKGSKSKKKSSKNTIGGVGMTRSLVVDTSDASNDEVSVETKRNGDDFALVTSAYKTISIESSVDDDEEMQHEAIDCMLESVSSIFDERRFAEFIPDSSPNLKYRSFLVAEEDDGDVTEGAVMAVKLLGDFGLYGVQPLCLSYELDEGDDTDDNATMLRCIAFHTLKGGHFDGELRLSVEQKITSLVLSVVLAIPNGARKPPTRLAESIVSSLVKSISHSSQIRMKQTQSRKSQSKQYRERASGRATEKRHERYEQEKLQEEMAAERKRKWKRNNPDAGRYTPSGHRLRSPDGHPKFS
ncbi:predicted protein [Thalassiosira pseudonana CCMP1335]|uniref:Uncharacterized protein n=1 Tax=Thalassiosira pseudonana TaxID=35128 RepID=B8BSY3_THAPS|nr:predicted protein [Thalassiosira pseudonana CCMP1335]EED96209.1 predicted protein [Thalassiosira pseudonana CCMP1335]